MLFREYQNAAKQFAVYPKDRLSTCAILGLVSEAGEVADKMKKIIRDKGGVMSDNDKKEFFKEVGDVLWYVSALCTDYGMDMGSIAIENIKKLTDRAERAQLNGSGDNR